MSEPAAFDPAKYLTRVGGNDYLEVKWRLLWLRQTHPDAGIDTELVSHADNFAVFRARVSLPDGGYATGWGSEGLDDFRDYLEKAETKAIGRALAALGFGTQFCADFDFGGGGQRTVDGPIDFATTRGRRAAGIGNRSAGRSESATPSQIKFIQALAREVGLSDDQLNAEAMRLDGRPVGELGRRDASALIEWLQARRGMADLSEPGPSEPPESPQTRDDAATKRIPPDKADARPGPSGDATGASDRDAPMTGGVTDPQRRMILGVCDKLGIGDDERRRMQETQTGHASLSTMGKADASRFIDYLKTLEPEPPEPGSPEDLASITAIADSSRPGAHLAWTETQLLWKKTIDKATSDRQFDAIANSLPRDKHGNPDAMLTDYLAAKREQIAQQGA